MDYSDTNCIAFEGTRCIACGPLAEVALKAKETSDAQPLARILIFNSVTSDLIEIDCRGSVADVMGRIAPATKEISLPVELPVSTPAGRGRPKLGVVAREVTLLPRHWEWLSSQPGGASVALRKLVEQAKRASSSADQIRKAQNVTYQFMSVMAGCLDGFEEASRALFAADRSRFEALLAAWPVDIREHLQRLAEAAFPADEGQNAQHA